ncbi:MAG: hypothetical protein OTJ97_04240, partial [SAR202 cluster bacterium]|nr:hypothetical protein [SAR202 cluster bacterium]
GIRLISSVRTSWAPAFFTSVSEGIFGQAVAFVVAGHLLSGVLAAALDPDTFAGLMSEQRAVGRCRPAEASADDFGSERSDAAPIWERPARFLRSIAQQLSQLGQGSAKKIVRLYVDDGNIAVRRPTEVLVNVVVILLLAYLLGFGFGLKKTAMESTIPILGSALTVTLRGGSESADKKKISGVLAHSWRRVSLSRKALISFLCTFGYNQRFVRAFSSSVAPLRELSLLNSTAAFTKAMSAPGLEATFEKAKAELVESIQHEALDENWARDPRGHPHVSIDSCFEFCSCTVTQTSRDAPTVHRIIMHAQAPFSPERQKSIGRSSTAAELCGAQFCVRNVLQDLPAGIPIIFAFDCSGLAEREMHTFAQGKKSGRHWYAIALEVLDALATRTVYRVQRRGEELVLDDQTSRAGDMQGPIQMHDLHEILKRLFAGQESLAIRHRLVSPPTPPGATAPAPRRQDDSDASQAADTGAGAHGPCSDPAADYRRTVKQSSGEGTLMVPGGMYAIHVQDPAPKTSNDPKEGYAVCVDLQFSSRVVCPSPHVVSQGSLREGIEFEATYYGTTEQWVSVRPRAYLFQDAEVLRRPLEVTVAPVGPANPPLQSAEPPRHQGPNGTSGYSAFRIEDEAEAEKELEERAKVLQVGGAPAIEGRTWDKEVGLKLFGVLRDYITPFGAAVVAKMASALSAAFWGPGRPFPTVQRLWAWHPVKAVPTSIKNQNRPAAKGLLDRVMDLHMKELIADTVCDLWDSSLGQLPVAVSWLFLALRKGSYLGRVVVDAVFVNGLFAAVCYPMSTCSEVVTSLLFPCETMLLTVLPSPEAEMFCQSFPLKAEFPCLGLEKHLKAITGVEQLRDVSVWVAHRCSRDTDVWTRGARIWELSSTGNHPTDDAIKTLLATVQTSWVHPLSHPGLPKPLRDGIVSSGLFGIQVIHRTGFGSIALPPLERTADFVNQQHSTSFAGTYAAKKGGHQPAPTGAASKSKKKGGTTSASTKQTSTKPGPSGTKDPAMGRRAPYRIATDRELVNDLRVQITRVDNEKGDSFEQITHNLHTSKLRENRMWRVKDTLLRWGTPKCHFRQYWDAALGGVSPSLPPIAAGRLVSPLSEEQRTRWFSRTNPARTRICSVHVVPARCTGAAANQQYPGMWQDQPRRALGTNRRSLRTTRCHRGHSKMHGSRRRTSGRTDWGTLAL